MLKPGQLSIFLTHSIMLPIFTFLYLSRKNYEFILYLAVIVFFFALILLTNQKIQYPNSLLWGLTLWAFLHLSGGYFFIHGVKLYELILVPVSAQYGIFRFDQLVHIIGFGVATLLMHALMQPLFNPKAYRPVLLGIIVVMAGLGVGAINEIVEFIATVVVPETGVGGYTNTALDLVADLVGALLALSIIMKLHKQNSITKKQDTSIKHKTITKL